VYPFHNFGAARIIGPDTLPDNLAFTFAIPDYRNHCRWGFGPVEGNHLFAG
jgi:hypothetical protein